MGTWNTTHGRRCFISATRDQILVRDNNACRRCRIVSDRNGLEVHHIIARSVWPHHAKLDVDDAINQITLCTACHTGVTDTTLPDYAEWKLAPSIHYEKDLQEFWYAMIARYEGGPNEVVRAECLRNPGKEPWLVESRILAPEEVIRDIHFHAARGESINITDPDKISEALSIQDKLVELRAKVNDGFKSLAVMCAEVHANHLWRVNHEKLDDFLRRPDINIERSFFYRLVGFGRLLLAHPEPGLLPALDVTTWTKHIAPIAKFKDGKLVNKEEVEEVAALAEKLPARDFQKSIEVIRPKKERVPCQFQAGDMVFNMDGVLIGHLSKAWSSHMGTYILVSLPNGAPIQLPLKIVVSNNRPEVIGGD